MPARVSQRPDGIAPSGGGGRVAAVLGPTNTGKTYLAIERMMGHASGMMGFPLRLLARENYDRVVAVKGADKVALVTGEEKILPPNPSYFLCTVESMPLGREVAFLGVDEVQLAADPDRGHVFTDRILHARGYAETMLLGSDTMAPFIRRLVPGCEFVARPRFSTLSYAGTHKITRLPPRSAVVAFSAAGVYGIAELLRRQRGGAAVVMGALSPRTRNAQVAMFQAGEVDYLVATDAIGMGLNMDVAHVAFGELAKFDGHRRRALAAAELAQIAGRAGHHMADGTFGTTVEAGPLAPELVAAIEGHAFERVRAVYWRNRDLVFASLPALMASLDRPPPGPGMVAVRDVPDHAALKALAAEPDIADIAARPDTVRLLWEVCGIPDFRHAAGPGHARFLAQVFRRLAVAGRLEDDWIAAQIARLDRADGDIETLTGRIDHIRTWTYISHRADWVRDAGQWQGRTRVIEDRLSDALHDRLTQRFVDRRTTALVKGLKADRTLAAVIGEDGEVSVEGHVVGRLQGLRFHGIRHGRLAEDSEIARRAVRAAAARALAPEIAARLAGIAGGGDDVLALADDGRILWKGAAVAALAAGREALSPAIRVLPSDLLDPRAAGALAEALQRWFEGHLRRELGPLLGARAASDDALLPGAVRGILYQLAHGLGAVPRRDLDGLVRGLDPPGRRTLARLGVRLGTGTVYLDRLDAPAARRLRAILHGVAAGRSGAETAGHAAALAHAAQALPRDPAIPDTLYRACGFVPLGPRALGCARAEALAAEARKLARQGAFGPTLALRRLAGGGVEDLVGVLLALGFRTEGGPDGPGFAAAGRGRGGRSRVRPPATARAAARGARGSGPDSPFARLGELKRRR